MRDRKITCAVWMALLLSLSASLSSCGKGPERPDVLLITLDTTRWDYISAYGAGRARTPHIDSVAARGILFTHAFTTAPVTLPAHASLMTGLYPPSHGARNNGMYRLAEGVPTLAGVLGPEGYATAAVIGAFVLDSQFGLDSGFEFYDDEFGGRGAARPSFSYLERDAGSVTEAAIAILRDTHPPRFLWVHYFDPHYPYTPPAPFDAQYRQDLYAGEVAYVDACVGRLLEALRDASGGREPLIIIAGDHGEDLGDHGEMSHGIFLYDSTVKIPLMMACPGRLPAGVAYEPPVSLVDVFPTILDILGMGPEGISVQGRSLLEFLHQGSEPERALYLETMTPLENMGWSPLTGVIAGRYKYIRAPKAELYDVGRDPVERENLLESEKGRGEIMAALLDSLAGTLSSKAGTAAREMDEETREKLASLGYVLGYGGSGPSLKDPKDMLPVLKAEQKGLSLYEAGDYTGAEQAFAEALTLDPTNVTLLNYRALSLFALGKVRDSLLLWEKALALSPGYLDLRLNLGMAQLAAGAPDSALASYGKVLEANPRYVKALVGKGKALRAKGLHEEAHGAFAQAVEYSPRNAEARFWLGVAKKEEGDREGALREIEEAALLDPTMEEVSRERAMILSSLGRTEEAVTILEGLASKSSSPTRFVDLGYVLEGAGRLEEALRAYEDAIRFSSDSYMAHNNAGSLLDRMGRTEEAERSLRRALAIKEDFPEAHYNLGFLLKKLGRREEAGWELKRFLELWKKDDGARNRAREALGELG
jgi:arylsulfatase A-like enzyme/Flp pilus assembly protein TadD